MSKTVNNVAGWWIALINKICVWIFRLFLHIPANIWKSAKENMWCNINLTVFHMLWISFMYLKLFIVEFTMAINFVLNNILRNSSHFTTPASKGPLALFQYYFSLFWKLFCWRILYICHLSYRSDGMTLPTKLMQFRGIASYFFHWVWGQNLTRN